MWRYGIIIRTYVQLGCIPGGMWLEERRKLIWSSGSIPRFQYIFSVNTAGMNKLKTATAVVELLIMGMTMPETC
jgi:hypothetical protein